MKLTKTEVSAKWLELTSDWKSLRPTSKYAVSKCGCFIVSHYKDSSNDSVVVTETTEEAFLAHYGKTDSMLNTELNYDITEKHNGKTELAALNMLFHMSGEDTYIVQINPDMRKFKAHRKETITLGNSAHPIKQYGLTARRTPMGSAIDAFVLACDMQTVLILPDCGQVIVMNCHVSSFDASSTEEDAMTGLRQDVDPRNKYLGNDIMSALSRTQS